MVDVQLIWQPWICWTCPQSLDSLWEQGSCWPVSFLWSGHGATCDWMRSRVRNISSLWACLHENMQLNYWGLLSGVFWGLSAEWGLEGPEQGPGFPGQGLQFCYDVVQCTALLNLELRGIWTSASAHALCLTTSYSCPSISDVFWGLQGFQKCWKWSRSLEVNMELECSPERGEHRGQV